MSERMSDERLEEYREFQALREDAIANELRNALLAERTYVNELDAALAQCQGELVAECKKVDELREKLEAEENRRVNLSIGGCALDGRQFKWERSEQK